MGKENKPIILIDTNLLISSIIIKGRNTPNILFSAWKQDRYTLALSEELITEIENVLHKEKIYKKYHILPDEIKEFIKELRFSANLIIPLPFEDLPIHSRDIKDDKLLCCAIAGNCDYLVTGDQDLLVLSGDKLLGKIKIVTAKELISML
ncbi:MAG: putative toxin-antitoxin system toxin component, PIN family [Patescibacteria group bacterium]|nr:putative toxin-antitoxin system toxin component, PIN family [Patescibacteria group bacterium]